jgi:DNA-binding NtrC family response regulator
MKNGNNIFIVEDDPFYREIILNHLLQQDFDSIQVFKNGKELSDNLYKNPDIILLDYNLTDKNGLELLKEVKGFNPDIQVVFLSGQETIEVAVESLRYGAFDYILKNDLALDKLNKVLSKIQNINKLVQIQETRRKLIRTGAAFTALTLGMVLVYVLNS